METPALKAAVELIMMPSRARILRDAPLPAGIPVLLRIAAGDTDAESEAATAIERPAKVVREAAAFYIEQVLLHPEADSFRVLGASPQAPPAELRQNMALLMRWLHPDSAKGETRAAFVNRVNRAWDDLKTPERRLAYDKLLASKMPRPRSSQSRSGSRSGNHRRKPVPPPTYQRRDLQARDLIAPLKTVKRSLLRRALGFLLTSRRPS